jgi:Ca2+-binding EF-hand superfamily protein
MHDKELCATVAYTSNTALHVQEALNKLGLPGNSHAYIADLLKQYDRNHDGSIDWEEYKRYVIRKERIVQRTFQKLDEDGSGSVSAEELVHIPAL